MPALLDIDGTLWAKQPLYFQALYAFDRLAQKAAADPSIVTSDGLRAGANGDIAGALARGLDEADARGWVLVDMAEDWRRKFSGGQ